MTAQSGENLYEILLISLFDERSLYLLEFKSAIVYHDWRIPDF